MPVSATPARRARLFSCCPLVLLVLLLAAGCRSSQSAYQFRAAPAPERQQAMVPEPQSAVTTAGASAEAIATARPAGNVPPVARQRLKPRQVRQQVRLALAQVKGAYSASVRSGQSAGQQVAGAAAKPRKTSEVGLGTTVLGVLGLVVLPIALIGLLIWGGLVWAVLAGLAALAVLVAYLDPFR